MALMSIRYYTHFLLREGSSEPVSEYRGVVELNRAARADDAKEAARLLSKQLECEPTHVTVLCWSRLH